jgi:hypothetical protein
MKTHPLSANLTTMMKDLPISKGTFTHKEFTGKGDSKMSPFDTPCLKVADKTCMYVPTSKEGAATILYDVE